MSNTEELVALPVTKEEWDTFVANVIAYYKLPETDDTYESIATLILHMPQSSAFAPLSFFGNSVNKSRANAIAYSKMQEFSQKRRQAQIDLEASKQVDTAQVEAVSTNDQPISDT